MFLLGGGLDGLFRLGCDGCAVLGGSGWIESGWVGLNRIALNWRGSGRMVDSFLRPAAHKLSPLAEEQTTNTKDEKQRVGLNFRLGSLELDSISLRGCVGMGWVGSSFAGWLNWMVGFGCSSLGLTSVFGGPGWPEWY